MTTSMDRELDQFRLELAAIWRRLDQHERRRMLQHARRLNLLRRWPWAGDLYMRYMWWGAKRAKRSKRRQA